MLNLFKKQKINRYVSFTFDDGFINSAKKIHNIIYPNKATFYIVSKWLNRDFTDIKDKFNIGADHGDIKQWKQISEYGHEIGSHTMSHVGPDTDDFSEYLESLNFIRNFGSGPYSLAMPYGLKSSSQMPYDSVRLCNGKNSYNLLENINFSELISFDPFEGGLMMEDVMLELNKMPSDCWLIIRAHGLDNEGYCPWPSKYFKKIYELLLMEEFNIKTVREMTLKLINK
ncbi:MAG: polysaccharide deacetylase family protein [Candidatus Buchananbacteria bacterium]